MSTIDSLSARYPSQLVSVVVIATVLAGCFGSPNEQTDPWMGAEIAEQAPSERPVPLSPDGPSAYRAFLADLDRLLSGETAKISCTMRDQHYDSVTGHLARLEREATGTRGSAPGPFFVLYGGETIRLRYRASALGDIGAPVDYCLER